MFAVVKVGGRQYRVSPGDEFVVEKLNLEPGSALQLPVLLWSDESGVKIGQPLVDGQSVAAQVLGDIRGHKMDVFRYQSKKRYRKKTGHRQTYTRIKIMGDKPQAAPEPAIAEATEPAVSAEPVTPVDAPAA
jgi:large subunit ribosomal protein L21